MRKFLLITTQLFLTVIVFGQSYKYTSQNLNMRGGPGTSYQVLATIPAGTNVKLAEDCVCEWIRVHYNCEIGYVNSKYLKSEREINSLKSNVTTPPYQRNISTGTTHYKKAAGKRVQSPARYNSIPAGATAICRDGTYSFSKSRRGTCSHHGGVAEWL